MSEHSSLLSRKILFGASLGAALFFMLLGVIFWGGFNTAMEATNTLDFCITCHEMKDNVYKEYKETIHFTNRSGVRAACSDCHVPDPWVHKVVRKIQASNEVFHKIIGSVNTPEKFDGKRLELAKRVWKAMKSTDSRECRNCHDFGSMNPANQKPRARKQHMNAMEQGNTCIDCHKGIAHKKVHHLLTDEEIETLQKPDPSTIRPMPEQWANFDESAVEAAAPAAAPVAAPAAAPTGGDVDWGKASSRVITLFYPGQTSMEWVLNGRDHGGSRPVKIGDRCFECHDKETADMGKKIVTGEKAEPNPIPGKRGSIPVTVRAAHDGENLYLNFQWPDTEHAPVPFADGGKMDPDNQVKLALMFATDDVEYAGQAGCWGTCHHDLRTMPDAPDEAALGAAPAGLDVSDGITKYISESRTDIEVRGRRGKARGGWDKLKSDDELKAALEAGQIMDLVRYKAGEKLVEDGYILKQRVMDGGQGAEFNAELKDGVWSVTMKRKLQSDKPGDISLALDQVYNFGFAIHDDYSNARYHHVSLGYKLGFDNAEAEINALRQ